MQFNADMHLCYKKSFIKQHILAYQPEVLLWHQAVPPQQQQPSSHPQEGVTPNNGDFSNPDYDALLAARLGDSCADHSAGPPANLDIHNVADFCLPWGASIESWSVYQALPKPVFFTFVLTDASYERLHGSALTFYEPYDISLLDMDKCFHLDLDPELVSAPKQNGVIDSLARADAELFTADELRDIERHLGVFRRSRIGDKVVGTSKTICILSRYYFGSSFKPFLSFLHQRCLGDGEEKSSIPLERYLAFLFYEIPFPDLRLPNVVVDLDGHYLRLQAPREKNAASSTAISEPFASLLTILGTELCLQLLVQLLTEQKILLISVQPDLLAHIAQALISIIYPLRWVLVYIPFIHIRCIHVIQSPSPYLIGVDSRFFEFFRLPPGENITCVDLDTRNFRAAKDNMFKDTKCLPKGLYKKLKSQLLTTEKRLASLHHSMRAEAQSGVPLDLKLHQQVHQVGLSIKRAFLTFMAQLLYDYRRYVLPVGSTESGILFDSEAYVKEVCDHSSRPFYRALFGTQLWADFIRDLTCVSDRTAEFEAFDNFIDDIHPGGGVGGDFEDGSVVSSGSGSSSLPHSRGHSGLLANGSSPGGSFSTLDDLPTDLPGGLFSTTTRLIHSDKTKVIKTPETGEDDDLIADLRNKFTWTEWGTFPNHLNNEALEELRRRNDAAKQSQVLRPSVSMVAFCGTGLWDTSVLSNSTAAAAAMGQLSNASNSDFTRFAALAPASEEFQPQRRFVGEPPPFPAIFRVADVFGVAKLNSLLKRTQQETTACLIFDTKCRQQGNSAWAGFLMTEIYSLWFILLPAFIASLDQRFSQAAPDAQKSSISLQARTLLFEASCLFFRLMNTSLYTVDQVMVRILLVLLFEYGALTEQTFNSWCEMPLNATSYALANQLQRELGPKLAGPEENSTAPPVSQSFSSASAQPQSLTENVNFAGSEEDTQPTLIPQALSTPRVRRATVSTPPRAEPLSQHNPEQATAVDLIDFGAQEAPRPPDDEALEEQKDLCNNLAHLHLSPPPPSAAADEADRSMSQPAQQGAEKTDQDPALAKITSAAQPAGSPFTRGLRSFAMRSMRSINSFANQMKSVEWVAANSPAITTDARQETVIVFPSRVTTRRPTASQQQQQQGWNKLPGYRNLFAMPKSNRLPRNMRPWTLGEPCRDSGRKFSLDRNALFATDPRAPQPGSTSGAPQPQSSANPLSAPSSSASFQTSGPPPVVAGGPANPAWEDQTSWFQGIRSGLQKHLTSLSPALQRQATSMDELRQTPRGSINSLETEDSNVLGGDSFGGGGSYQPPSWHDIAGELAVGSPATRVCLVNPLLSQLTPDAQTTRQRRLSGLSSNHSRSSSCLASPAAGTDGRSRRNSASSPVAAPATSSGPRISPSSSSPALATSGGRERNNRSSETRSPPRVQSPSATASPSSPTRARKPPPRPRPGSPSPPPPSPAYRVQDLRIIATACSVCPSCLRNVYEEEILSEWMTCEDEVNVHCPFCRHLFTPKLTIRTVAICDDAGSGGGGGSQEPAAAVDKTDPSIGSSPASARSRKAPFSHGLVEYTVPFVNPSVLRKDLELFPSMTDFMGTETWSSPNLLGRHDTLLWNLVYLFHRLGLPTHLLDRYPAWLMDCQAEFRRTADGRRHLGSLVIARALADVVLSPDLPVWMVAKWDIFPRKGTPAQPLYRLWVKQTGQGEPNQLLNDGTDGPSETECCFGEIVRLTSDALTFKNLEGAISALLSVRDRRADERRDSLNDLRGSAASSNAQITSWSRHSSLYRELFLLFIRIHGCAWTTMDEFDFAYKTLFAEYAAARDDRFSVADAPPSSTAVACRLLFRSLVLG
ncbi:hypothetical protein AAHC03_024173 [Spirometra sp. Aus1]